MRHLGRDGVHFGSATGCHLDRLADRAELQLDGHRCILCHFDVNALCRSPEPLFFHRNFVIAGSNIAKGEQSRIVSRRGLFRLSGEIGHGYPRVGDDSVIRVGNFTAERTELRLGNSNADQQ